MIPIQLLEPPPGRQNSSFSYFLPFRDSSSITPDFDDELGRSKTHSSFFFPCNCQRPNPTRLVRHRWNHFGYKLRALVPSRPTRYPPIRTRDPNEDFWLLSELFVSIWAVFVLSAFFRVHPRLFLLPAASATVCSRRLRSISRYAAQPVSGFADYQISEISAMAARRMIVNSSICEGGPSVARTDYCDGLNQTIATIRSGPPLPPLIFIGNAITEKPFSG